MKIKRFISALLIAVLILPSALGGIAQAAGWSLFNQTTYGFFHSLIGNKIDAEYVTFTEATYISSIGFYSKQSTNGSIVLYIGIQDSSHTTIVEETLGAISTISTTVGYNAVDIPITLLDPGSYYFYIRASSGTGTLSTCTEHSNVTAIGDYWEYNGSSWTEYSSYDTAFGFLYFEGDPTPTVSTGGYSLDFSTGNLTLFGWLYTIGESGNLTDIGFEIGYESGNYTDNISWVPDLDFTEGLFYGSSTDLDGGNDVYYRAYATNNVTGTGYGEEKSFFYIGPPHVSTGQATETTAGGSVVYTLTGDIQTAGDGTDYVSIRGFDIGLAEGSWSPGLRLDELAGGSGGWDGAIGDYAISTSLLSANTTYYYRAWAGLYSGAPEYTWRYGYGETANFTTSAAGVSASVPKLTTDSVIYFEGGLTMGGTIVSSEKQIVERGFQWGLDSGFTGAASKATTGTFPTGFYTATANANYTPGQVVYVRAYCVDSADVYGYGNTITYTVPLWPIGPGGLAIANDTVTVNGNSVTLRANVTNPGGVTLTRWSFQWEGKTTIDKDGSFSQASSGVLTSFSHSVFDLVEDEIYYFRSGVLTASGNWYWSDWTTFTTGGTLTQFTGSAPIITTLEATTIGVSGFTANGNLLNLGFNSGSEVSELGFAVSDTKSTPVKDWSLITQTGNFSIGEYSRVINTSQVGGTVYYAAYAVNQYGAAWGKVYAVTLADAAGNPGDSIETPPGQLGFLTAMMVTLGLDTPAGHWVALGIAILLTFLVFLIPILGANDRKFKILFACILALVVICEVGAWLFSGLLGIWPVIGLIVGLGVLAAIVIGRIFGGNKS